MLPPGRTLTAVFTPDDSDNFETVTTTVSLVVNKADPVITWANPQDISVGTPLGATQLNATTDVLGTFTYAPLAGTVLAAGANQELTATFTPDEPGKYNEVTATVRINVVDALDYGDAPSSYPVLLADDGARHATSSLRLGSDLDLESDGQPTPNADGDGVDDDGVLRISDLIAADGVATTASVEVTVSADSKLDAWIDFNGNGGWEANEQIATSLDLTAGTNIVSFQVPGTATPGQTVSRFRVSSAGGLTPLGAATDGEVEDYLWQLLDGNANARGFRQRDGWVDRARSRRGRSRGPVVGCRIVSLSRVSVGKVDARGFGRRQHIHADRRRRFPGSQWWPQSSRRRRHERAGLERCARSV